MKVKEFLRRYFILLLSFFLGLAIASYFFLIYICSDEYLSYQVVRTINPEKIYVEYVDYACGECYPRLTEIYQNKDGKKILAKKPLYTHYPNDLDNPEDTILAVSGNRFILTAYREIEIRVNKNHQESQVFTSNIYVVGWEVVTPYSIWDNSSLPKLIKKNTPVKKISRKKLFIK